MKFLLGKEIIHLELVIYHAYMPPYSRVVSPTINQKKKKVFTDINSLLEI